MSKNRELNFRKIISLMEYWGYTWPGWAVEKCKHSMSQKRYAHISYEFMHTNVNKTLWERIFGRCGTTGTILWTCLTAVKQLSSYLTREDKSVTPLVCWTTQLIQYVPIDNKNCVISWQCLKICTSPMQTCLEPNCNIGHKWLQPGEKCLTQLYWYWQMCFHTHHIVQCIPVTNKGK